VSAPAAPPGRAADLGFRAAAALAGAILLSLLALPLVSLFLRVPPAHLLSRMGHPLVLDALRLSVVTSLAAAALVVLLGTPIAWLLASRRFPGKRALEVLVDLPMVLPPTVAGFALLMAFGRAGLLGGALQAFGITLPFTTLGVVVAQVFMASPFFIGAARAGFAGVDRRLLDAAATLRASERFAFFRVVLPLAAPSLLAGIAMGGARALGEFGATITFAGNLPGISQTMPLAVYVALQSDLEAALALSVMLLVLSAGLLLGLRSGAAARFWGRPPATRDAG
jgi:molybdate transport system permease protein